MYTHAESCKGLFNALGGVTVKKLHNMIGYLLTLVILCGLLSGCSTSPNGNTIKEDVQESGHATEIPSHDNNATNFISPEQTTSSEIELTMDNWHQYFEIRETPLWEENAFGEAETLYVRSCLFLRDEYRDKVDVNMESTAAFAFEYDWILTDVEINYETREYNYTEKMYADSKGHEESTLAIHMGMLIDAEGCGIICSCGEGYFTNDNGERIPNCYQFSNVEVTRVEGNIYLFDDKGD